MRSTFDGFPGHGMSPATGPSSRNPARPEPGRRSQPRDRFVKFPFPKEHGVWAMLASSLAGGFLIAGQIDLTGVSLLLGLALLLMSKAPIRDFLRNPVQPHALWAAGYLGASGLLLYPALVRLPPGILILSGLVMAPSVPVYLLAMHRRKEMRIRYEIPAMALLALAMPYAYSVSGGPDTGVAFSIFLLTFLYYSGSSFRVRSTPESKSLRAGLLYDAAVISGVLILAVSGTLPPVVALAFLPFLENIWRALNPRREKLSHLGRIELLKVVVYLFFLVLAYRT